MHPDSAKIWNLPDTLLPDQLPVGLRRDALAIQQQLPEAGEEVLRKERIRTHLFHVGLPPGDVRAAEIAEAKAAAEAATTIRKPARRVARRLSGKAAPNATQGESKLGGRVSTLMKMIEAEKEAERASIASSAGTITDGNFFRLHEQYRRLLHNVIRRQARDPHPLVLDRFGPFPEGITDYLVLWAEGALLSALVEEHGVRAVRWSNLGNSDGVDLEMTAAMEMFRRMRDIQFCVQYRRFALPGGDVLKGFETRAESVIGFNKAGAVLINMQSALAYPSHYTSIYPLPSERDPSLHPELPDGSEPRFIQ